MSNKLLTILYVVINFYSFLIFFWAILSWFRDTKIKLVKDLYRALDMVVAPYVNLFRKFIRPMGGMDFTPFIALLVLQLVVRLLFGLFV